MYVGLDVSKREIVCVGKDKEGRVLYQETFETSAEEMDRLVDAVGCDSMFAVEASTKGVFVYDYLSQKVHIVVANPHKIRLIAESEKKTDWEDAGILADLLRTNMLPLCYMPDKEVRQVRDLIRQRKSLVEIRTTIKNKIRAILAREGIEIPYRNIVGDLSLNALDGVRIDNEVQMEAVDRLIRLTSVLNDDISDYDAKVVAKYRISKEAQLIDTVPGISNYSAVHIMSAIGDIRRFSSDEQLVSYAGLAPKVYQSGETRIDRGLKHGDKLLNWILIQDANAAIRSSKKFRKYYLKVKRRKGHNVAIISVARKMTQVIYCMLTRGEPYSEDYGK